MKKILFAVSTIGLFAATPALAQPATGDILLSVNVLGQCGVGNHKSGAASAPGWDQSDIVVNLTNAGNGQFSGQVETDQSFGNVWCNGPAQVTMTVSALTSTSSTTDTSSFTNRFDVRVVTDAGVYLGLGQDAVFNTTGQAGGVHSATFAMPQAFETGLQRFGGADSIEILADPSNRRAVAGTYSGAITFTASAN